MIFKNSTTPKNKLSVHHTFKHGSIFFDNTFYNSAIATQGKVTFIVPYLDYFAIKINTKQTYMHKNFKNNNQAIIQKAKNTTQNLIDPIFAQSLRDIFYIKPMRGLYQYKPIINFYGLLVKQLKSIFRNKAIDFINKEFKDYFVIGIHVRVGNGEPLIQQKRIVPSAQMIANYTYFFIKFFINGNKTNLLPNDIDKVKLFISTDTLSAVDEIKMFLHNRDINVSVVSLPQVRMPVGHGFIYRSPGINTKSNNQIDCIGNAAGVYLDMEILGFTDLLIIPVASSFSRLARVLMIKREKIICVTQENGNYRLPNKTQFVCRDFKTNKYWLKHVNTWVNASVD